MFFINLIEMKENEESKISWWVVKRFCFNYVCIGFNWLSNVRGCSPTRLWTKARRAKPPHTHIEEMWGQTIRACHAYRASIIVVIIWFIINCRPIHHCWRCSLTFLVIINFWSIFDAHFSNPPISTSHHLVLHNCLIIITIVQIQITTNYSIQHRYFVQLFSWISLLELQHITYGDTGFHNTYSR